MTHSPRELVEACGDVVESGFEDALVMVVNSANHDDAVRIATEALSGERGD